MKGHYPAQEHAPWFFLTDFVWLTVKTGKKVFSMGSSEADWLCSSSPKRGWKKCNGRMTLQTICCWNMNMRWLHNRLGRWSCCRCLFRMITMTIMAHPVQLPLLPICNPLLRLLTLILHSHLLRAPLCQRLTPCTRLVRTQETLRLQLLP